MSEGQKVLVVQSSPSLFRPHGLQPTGLLCPWDSPGKNTGVGGHSLLHGIFLTQGSNLSLLGFCFRFFTGWATREAQSVRNYYLVKELFINLSFKHKKSWVLSHTNFDFFESPCNVLDWTIWNYWYLTIFKKYLFYFWLCWVFVALCGLPPVAMHSLVIMVPSLVRTIGSVSVAHRLSCTPACGILPEQGSNPCPLHWQAEF